mgnify:CR=1 FL=1|tara:strand:+ start:2383 stop:3045 length:663 start_codon:yes stop_codon:yes gene_type:complete
MRLFSSFGIPVRLHYSFIVLAAAWVIYNGLSLGLQSALVSALIGGFLFGSVLLHEFGHALMAKTFGIETRHITLYPFGGIAAIESEPPTGLKEFFISIAGPAVNFILAGFMAPLLLIDMQIVPWLIGINLVMGIFNLIPAFPMDGGRIFRSLLCLKIEKERATMISLNFSLGWAALFLITGAYFQGYGLILVGAFLFYIVNQERKRIKHNQSSRLELPES